MKTFWKCLLRIGVITNGLEVIDKSRFGWAWNKQILKPESGFESHRRVYNLVTLLFRLAEGEGLNWSDLSFLKKKSFLGGVTINCGDSTVV